MRRDLRYDALRLLATAVLPVLVGCATARAIPAGPTPSDGLTLEQLASLRRVRAAHISPDGMLVAYTLTRPRVPGADPDGPAWEELWVVPFEGGPARAWVHGWVNVSRLRFTPDGERITYLARRGVDAHAWLWAIPVGGGESRRLIGVEEEIGDYRISPDGTRVAFLASEPERPSRRDARSMGFDQEVFEEDYRHSRLWIAPLPELVPDSPAPWSGEDASGEPPAVPTALEIEGSVMNLEWFPDGRRLAIAVAPRPLVDDWFMLRRLRVVDAESGRVRARIENPGKLGAFAPSPDGSRLALISAADYNDPSPGRLMVVPAEGGALRDVLPDLMGHVRSLAWQDASTLMFLADVRTGTVFGEVDVETGERKDHCVGGAGEGSPILARPSISRDGQRAVFTGSAPHHPDEVYALAHGELGPRRLTDGNPWLTGVPLARQEVVRYRARDGLELEGILVHPAGGEESEPAPLILAVHGGPEGHVRNGWVTDYDRPGQAAAARGFAVFYPNYRGSTGRGVAFTKLGQGDAAGREFDDLIDAIDHLAELGVADRARVGVTGGSYGGYATAWLSTWYTERIRAGVMFIGISNKLTKGLTTDVPYEDMGVHTLYPPWSRWQYGLERSPIFHAEKCRTPLLIAGGTADTRIHPSQSLQLYRALEMQGQVPVRWVRYPGEPHGNLRATSRYDFSRRMLRWFEHYLMGSGGQPPEWDLRLGEGGE